MIVSCAGPETKTKESVQPVYQDVPYLQDYSIKYYNGSEGIELKKVFSDRNGVIKGLSSRGLFRTHAGQFLYPGELVPDGTYRPMGDKNLAGMTVYENQFVYVDNEAVLSNAWAGKLFNKHSLPKASIIAGGKDFTFLVSDGNWIECVQDKNSLWSGETPGDKILEIEYDKSNDIFWILGEKRLYTFNPKERALNLIIKGMDYTCLAVADEGSKIFVGTKEGYFIVDGKTGQPADEVQKNLPCAELTAIEEVNGNIWFGSTNGAFMLREDGQYNYYNGERWLAGNNVKQIASGPENSVLILSDNGVGQICFKEMTLYDKAMYYEKQVRDRHIRNGFNANLNGMEKGNVDTGYLRDSDNDGLWTSMYLAGEAFRYAVTKSDEALQNCRESLDAMERLYTINSVPGFPSRSFERSGYIEVLADPHRWQHSNDPEWDWKATTSSDEAIGHAFVLGVMAELIDDKDIKDRSINLIDSLMEHIVDNDFYLIDYDGKPTTWGRWNPEYVNGHPKMVGDRKLNSSNIVAMLQTAYHFTKKEKFKEAADKLMIEHGYLENLMRPMSMIGKAEEGAEDWSKMLSGSWNHSDDEMYFLGYWGLYRYAFNDSLQQMYKKAIIDHWEAERPEKEGLWDIMTALTGTPDFDLDEAVWWLKEHPMDLIDWVIMNSQRKDIELVEPNFREQTVIEVLPPDERPVQRHNGNMFHLDRRGGNGTSEHSAGDIWLLPYWMGRYLGVISEPVSK